MLEFGLCTFTWREPQQKFVAQPYNFYLFPQDDLKVKLESESFLCETSSLECMAKHGFNFNTCIQHGISYMSKDQESMAGVRMDFQADDYAGVHMLGKFRHRRTSDAVMSSADKMFSHHIRTKLMQWRSATESSHQYHQTNDENGVIPLDGCVVKKSVRGEFVGSRHKDKKSSRLIDSRVIWYKSCEPPRLLRASMKWESLAHHELLMLLEVIHLDFNDLVAVVQPESLSSTSKNVHVFYAASYQEKVLLLEELEQGESKEKERQLSESIGFRHIIDAMVDSKKPVVGHHCILDFAHILKSFIKPLPLTTAKFTAGLLESFPCIIDTKYLLKIIPQLENDKDIQLDALCLKLFGNHGSEKCRVMVEISDEQMMKRGQLKSFGRLSSIQQEQNRHDSGNNAYLAGCLFAHICNVTNTDPCQIKKLSVAGVKTGIGRHVNLLCMYDTLSSVMDLSRGCEVANVAGSQKKLDNSNVILLWGYPRGTSPVSLQSAINEALKSSHPVGVFPLDDSSALVQLNHPEAVEQFFVVIQRLPNCTDSEYPPLLAAGVRAARFAAYEFLCKYSPSMQRLADCAKHLKLGFYGLLNNDSRCSGQ